MTETIACPKHGDRPAVPSQVAVDAAYGFTMCRSCWYLEWLAACLRYGRRHRRAA